MRLFVGTLFLSACSINSDKSGETIKPLKDTLTNISSSPKPDNFIEKAKGILDNSSNLLTGVYVGLEKMPYLIDPSNPKKVWYHLTYLKIKGDSAFLDQSPISIYKKDTTFSASDGGFYYYKGILIKTDTTLKIRLKEIFCDYCGEKVKKGIDGRWIRDCRIKEYFAKKTVKGIFLNGNLFTKTNRKENLISEHPRQ